MSRRLYVVLARRIALAARIKLVVYDKPPPLLFLLLLLCIAFLRNKRFVTSLNETREEFTVLCDDRSR